MPAKKKQAKKSPAPAADDDVLTRVGVADLLGVKPETISVYRSKTYKDSFPAPDGQLGATAYWYRSTIEGWQAGRPGRTGRPPGS